MTVSFFSTFYSKTKITGILIKYSMINKLFRFNYDTSDQNRKYRFRCSLTGKQRHSNRFYDKVEKKCNVLIIFLICSEKNLQKDFISSLFVISTRLLLPTTADVRTKQG